MATTSPPAIATRLRRPLQVGRAEAREDRREIPDREPRVAGAVRGELLLPISEAIRRGPPGSGSGIPPVPARGRGCRPPRPRLAASQGGPWPDPTPPARQGTLRAEIAAGDTLVLELGPAECR